MPKPATKIASSRGTNHIPTSPTAMTSRPAWITGRPNLGPSSAPDRAAPIAVPNAHGAIARPADSGRYPSPICRYRPKTSMKPSIAAKKPRMTARPPVNARLANSPASISGECSRRRSYHTKAPNTGSEPIIIA